MREWSHEQQSFPLKFVNDLFAWYRSIAAKYPSLWAAVESIAPKIGCVLHVAGMG